MVSEERIPELKDHKLAQVIVVVEEAEVVASNQAFLDLFKQSILILFWYLR